jgi:hypothetical protein
LISSTSERKPAAGKVLLVLQIFVCRHHHIDSVFFSGVNEVPLG